MLPIRDREKRCQCFQGFDVCGILICRGDEPTNAPAFNGSFNIFVQQYKACLFDEADRETERITMPQEILDLFKEGDFGIIGSSRKLGDSRTNGRKSEIANQGEEIGIVPITVADALGDLDFVVEALQLARADREKCMCNKAVQAWPFQF